MSGYLSITKQQARRFVLRKQGLLGETPFTGETGVLAFVRQAGCIQYDPIDVCGKNAELVLQARVAGFTKDMLASLLYETRKLVDYFDKNVSIWAVEDWPYFQRWRAAHYEQGHSRDEVNAVAQQVKDIVEERGWAASRDIDLNRQVPWSWNRTSLARATLETLYFRGELIIHHKTGSSKHYALAAEHLPAAVLKAPDPHESWTEHWKWRIQRRIGAVGLLWNRASDALLGLDGLKTQERKALWAQLLASHKLLEVRVPELRDPLYVLRSDETLLEQSCTMTGFPERMEFLAPLDNMLWDRRLVETLFDYRYRWEIYTPAEQRQFGYYVLPILWNDALVGRIEPVVDKQANVLRVKGIWWEEGSAPSAARTTALNDCLQRFAAFHGCSGFEYEYPEASGVV